MADFGGLFFFLLYSFGLAIVLYWIIRLAVGRAIADAWEKRAKREAKP